MKTEKGKFWCIAAVLICSIVVLLLSQGAEAAVFKVNSFEDVVDAAPGDGVCMTATGVCTLRAAVQQANALPGADVIKLQAGVYRLTLTGAGEDLAATGDLDITDSVTIKGKGAALTVVDGHHSDRVFHVFGPSTNIVNFIGLKIQNGVVIGSSFAGGGIMNEPVSLPLGGATVTVSGCIVTNNIVAAPLGGGIASALGNLKVIASRVIQNEIYSFGSPAVGGGILSYLDASVKIIGTKVADNLASNIGDSGGTSDVALGGGIALLGTSTVKIKSSKILGNVADSWDTDVPGSAGAGIYMLLVSSAKISNTKIANNTATGIGSLGGGVHAEASNATFSGCTITENSALGGVGGGGGGLYLQKGSDPMTITITNLSSIIYNYASAALGGGILQVGDVTLSISEDSVVANNLQDDINIY